MPKRDPARKPTKAVKAWATVRGKSIDPALLWRRYKRGDVRVLIVPLSGKVLMDETHDCRSTAETYILASEAAKGKRIRVLVLEEKP